MSIDSEKLIAFRKKENLTQSALAQSLNIKQQIIAMIENGSRPPSANFKLAFLKTYGIDWDSQTISGETLTYEQFTKNNDNVIPIPFYSAKAAAGEGKAVPDYPETKVIYFDKRWLQSVIGHSPEHLSLIRAEGNSMLPDIQDGDLLLVDDTMKEVIPNKTFVILQDNQLRVKKLKTEFNGEVLILSNNPAYPVEVMNKETTIVGQVVWNGSKENV